MILLGKALEIAYKAHEGQTDKSGKPYILHPIYVALGQRTNDAKIVGLLHDVVEDTDVSFDDLRDAGFPEYIIEAIDSVTKRDKEDIEDYYVRVVANKIGLAVKIADTYHNMQINRIANPSEKDIANSLKYKKRYYELLEHMAHDYE